VLPSFATRAREGAVFAHFGPGSGVTGVVVVFPAIYWNGDASQETSLKIAEDARTLATLSPEGSAGSVQLVGDYQSWESCDSTTVRMTS